MAELTVFVFHSCCLHTIPDVSDDGKASAALALLLFHMRGRVFLFSPFFRLSAFVCACYEYSFIPHEMFYFNKKLILLSVSCLNFGL